MDASVVTSARRPTKTLELLPEDREESCDEPGVTVTYSDDSDAAWLRKGNKAYYGYKMHVATDRPKSQRITQWSRNVGLSLQFDLSSLVSRKASL